MSKQTTEVADPEQSPHLEYPTGATVPFPYPTPYPQQTVLMDTLLQCLRQKDDEQKQQDSNNDDQKKQRRRTAVMMLESPTGTGKSLSLACSAMAWLKYCEQQDLTTTAIQQQEDDKDKAAAAAGSNNDDDDWWNAWEPPQQQENQEEILKTQQTAREARSALSQELELWRNKLYGDSPTKERIQQRRENFLQSAVTKAKMAERRAFGRRGKSKANKRKKTSTVIAAQEDYCVKDYNSDSEQQRSKRDYDEDSDSETDTKTTFSHHQNHNLFSATELLDGHRLDGSYRGNGRQPSHHTVTATTSATSSSTSSNNRSHGGDVGTGAAPPPGSGVRKIIYAARTHSQLSQFVGELKRTAWGDTCRVVALGSRQLLCGNAPLKRKHPTESSLTEACLDLKDGKSCSSSKSTSDSGKRKQQDNTTSSKGGCPLLESKNAISTLGLQLLTMPSDIEDAARLGSASRTCAYYASRKALAAAEVVVLPYSMLLSKPTRQAIGLSLQGCLVVVDEAHNLPEAIRQLHSSTLSLPVIQAALQQLTRYTQTYAQRLAGRNLMYLGHLRKLLQAFAKHLKQPPTSKKQDRDNHHNKENNRPLTDNHNNKPKNTKTLQSTIEFLLELKVDNINIFKLIHYLEQSRLSQKLLGFTRAKDEEEEKEDEVDVANVETTGLSKHVSAMSIVQTFLEKLNLQGQEGKIVTDWPSDSGGNNNSRVQHPTLRYVLLQPASCFSNVLEEAHALALVGGTLAPFGHVAAELLATQPEFLQLAAQADTGFASAASHDRNPYNNNNNSSSSNAFVSPQSFAAFTCDHVVPPSNVFVKCLSAGPGGQKLDFRHQSRMANALCQDLGQAILRLCKVIPHGLVVFLPSYNYEAHLVKQWQQSGLYEQLNQRKKIFREPKSAQQLEATLRSYAKQAAAAAVVGGTGEDTNCSGGGALLLSVIGGKMSEGINLSNSMARGVVIVGLPYPDVTDPELQEKMATMTKQQQGVAGGGISGQAYYQNLCMRAVNQSVGRAIRHANDYAAIFLADYRYSDQPKIWSALPKWLRNAATSNSPHNNHSFAALNSDLQDFFSAKETG